jgi:hypothetical protein
MGGMGMGVGMDVDVDVDVDVDGAQQGTDARWDDALTSFGRQVEEIRIASHRNVREKGKGKGKGPAVGRLRPLWVRPGEAATLLQYSWANQCRLGPNCTF